MQDRSRKKRPRDTNELAKLVVEIATGAVEDCESESKKNPHAVALGRLGGLKGGAARARKLTTKQRKNIAVRAATARWGKSKK